MKNIVGVKFNNATDIEYYYVDNINLKRNLSVIVENDQIEKFGYVCTDIHKIDDTKINRNIGNVVRISSKRDYKKYLDNLEMAKLAFDKCNQLIKKYKLEMRLLDSYYTFNQDQLIFNFCSDDRIDFRELAKELASIYKTRIELRQIGVRDKAKKIGGIGLCGQKLCCSRYMKDFDSVSISMAKNQNLSLNPNKINGVCGRLLCCLKFENDVYNECKKKLPKIGQIIENKDVKGKVISVDILRRTYKVETKDKGIIELNGEN